MVPLSRSLRTALLVPYLAVFYPFLALRRAGTALRPGRTWRTWITPRLLLGGFLLPTDVRALSQAGIGAVVNVSSELYDPDVALARASIATLRVPCWDTRVPSHEDAVRGVSFIAGELAAGRKVYVHCGSGVGRSVVLALCYLAAHEGVPVDEALAKVTRLRPSVSMSRAQRAFVDRFVAAYCAEAPM